MERETSGALTDTTLRRAVFGHATADLTSRQADVLTELLEGRSEKQIAERLSISVASVHVHIKTLHRRFDVHSRGELISKVFWLAIKRLHEVAQQREQ